MPELAEVETIRRDLQQHVVGDRIVRANLTRPDIVCGPPECFVSALQGKHITGTGRQGKILWLCLEDDLALGIHLRMSGQLRLTCNEAALPKHTHLILELTGGSGLIYVDPRRFGRLELLDTRRIDQAALLRNQGTDALSEQLTVKQLLDAAARHSIAIKQFLLDQTHLAGIGNIYACEILHRCRMHPDTPANRITPAQMQRLLDATRRVLSDAIVAGGTTLGDEQYQRLSGTCGGYQQQLQVYAREGEPCLQPGCSGLIHRTRQAGRSTYFCPACQPRAASPESR